MKIKQCPFCGNKAEFYWCGDDFGHHKQAAVMCENKDCLAAVSVIAKDGKIKIKDLKAEVVPKWNLRTKIPA